MTDVLMETEQMVEGRVVHVADRPIPFERFLDMAEGQWFELVDGVIVEKEAAVQLDHGLCMAWLYQVAGLYVKERGLDDCSCIYILDRRKYAHSCNVAWHELEVWRAAYPCGHCSADSKGQTKTQAGDTHVHQALDTRLSNRDTPRQGIDIYVLLVTIFTTDL